MYSILIKSIKFIFAFHIKKMFVLFLEYNYTHVPHINTHVRTHTFVYVYTDKILFVEISDDNVVWHTKAHKSTHNKKK